MIKNKLLNQNTNFYDDIGIFWSTTSSPLQLENNSTDEQSYWIKKNETKWLENVISI